MPEFSPKSYLRKTERGASALKARDPAITPKGRALMIMASGEKSAQDIVRLLPNPDESTAILGDLVLAGFLEVVAPPFGPGTPSPAPATPRPSGFGSSSPAPLAAQSAPAPLAASAAGDLKGSIQKASKLLYDMLGPTADNLCTTLERCKTYEEFEARLLDCRRVVAQVRSEKKADEFYNASQS
ncbi:hypothetical protein ACO2Q9_12475 [Variovorax sp. VNK109]|jgi:hypothetical protein|uniref:hypothetical protein n=1 Tax=Variovorax sp. VNK109 TaxID=3400919 RepID=UPI003C124AC5